MNIVKDYSLVLRQTILNLLQFYFKCHFKSHDNVVLN